MCSKKPIDCRRGKGQDLVRPDERLLNQKDDRDEMGGQGPQMERDADRAEMDAGKTFDLQRTSVRGCRAMSAVLWNSQ